MGGGGGGRPKLFSLKELALNWMDAVCHTCYGQKLITCMYRMFECLNVVLSCVVLFCQYCSCVSEQLTDLTSFEEVA